MIKAKDKIVNEPESFQHKRAVLLSLELDSIEKMAKNNRERLAQIIADHINAEQQESIVFCTDALPDIILEAINGYETIENASVEITINNE